MRVDLKVAPQLTTWRALREVCTEADQSGRFTGLWLYDHLGPVDSGGIGNAPDGGCLEGWSALAALADATTNVRLGLLVSAVAFRNVGLFGQIVTTVDQISGGRVEVGLGAGNNQGEADAFGLPFDSPGERTVHLEEYVDALRRLLRCDSEISFTGKYVTLHNAALRPRPVQREIPVLIGGKGERSTLRTAARAASGWNYSTGSPEEFAAKWAVLGEHAQRANRDLTGFRCSVQVRVPEGDPSTAVTLARRYLDAGATDIALYINAFPGQLEAACSAAATLKEVR